MLQPRESLTREIRSLDGMWDFAVDWNNDGAENGWADGLPGRTEIAVPSSVNDLFASNKVREHVGYWWYQTRVRVPRGWDGQQILVRCGSATHHASVWADGHHLGDFKGGYMPFEFDVTEYATPGEEFRLTIRVDNRLDNTCIPPGWVTTTEDGRRQQNYLHDFYNYSGLHRSVELIARPHTHVQDITVTSDIASDGTTGSLSWDIEASGEVSEVQVTVLDEGREVASATGAQGTVEIPDATIWTPGIGGMYDLRVRLIDAAGKTIDEYLQPCGIRTVEVCDHQFLINGKPFYFTGFGMHEDHETLGKGHSNAHMVQDTELLAWIGANSLRTSHYPYSEEFMDHCDRHGIVVIDETPAVGLNWKMGGGILDSDGGDTYEEGHVDEGTQAQHKLEIERLINRDKNRPSVVLWSIANEPDTATPAAREYFEPLVELTRALDPTRPVGYVNVMFAPYNECTISDLFDVLMLNRYYGWYVYSGDLTSAKQAFSAELSGWAKKYSAPIIITEYGADTVAGLHSVFDQPFTEDYQMEYLKVNSECFDEEPAVIGEQMWNFADFQTKYGFARVDGNKKGAFTRDRRPKAAARWLKNRWESMDAAAYGRRSPQLDER